MSFTPVPTDVRGNAVVTAAGESLENERSMVRVFEDILVELKLITLKLHELPRALNNGYAYRDGDDEGIRNDLYKEYKQ